MAETRNTNRRAFLKGFPAAITGMMAVPALAGASQGASERESMVAVIEQLEAWQGWEAPPVVAAKAFAAWQMRKALELDMPDPEHAQMHVDFQRRRFEDYQRTVWHERDREDGNVCEIAPAEKALA